MSALSNKKKDALVAPDEIQHEPPIGDKVLQALATQDDKLVTDDGPNEFDDVLGSLAQASPFTKALAERRASSRPLVSRVPKARRWVIGFGPEQIPPNSTVTVTAQPRCLFRGEKIINTGDSKGLYITGLFIGRKSQLPGPISVSVWESPLERGILMDTCDAALAITFQIQNVAAATLTWSMSIIGKAIL
jgi:hypothetical protein